GQLLPAPVLDADYWYRSLREPVAFAAVTRSLLADGYRFFVEASPHPALVVPLAETAQEAGAAVVVTGSLRRDQDDPLALARSLGQLHCRGLGVDWARYFRAWQPRRVDLPTYAFQRERFWLRDRPAGGDMASAGLAAAGHPLLGAAVSVAGSGGLVLTGRLSLADDPWLAGHTVFGRVIVPGAVFVEFALAAAERAGAGGVEELALEAVLALPADGGVTVQVAAGPADESGRRPVSVHARGDDGGAGGGWVRHASGVLGPAAEPAAAAGPLVAWPPEGGVVVPLDGFYQRLSAAGLGYGPSFQGLRAVWRRGGEVFAEVCLPDDAATAEGFGLHPVLLDAALHAGAVGIAEGAAQVELPFSWTGVSLHAARAVMARVRLEPLPGGHGVRVQLADGAGTPVATVQALVTRPASAGQLRDELAAREQQSLLALRWAETPPAAPAAAPAPAGLAAVVGSGEPAGALAGVAARVEHYPDFAALGGALDDGLPVPGLVIVSCAGDLAGGQPAAVHAAAARVLALVQGWLAEERLVSGRLAVLTVHAVAARPGEDVTDLAHAAVWGLVRAAQAEHSSRAITLIDTDDASASAAALAAAVLSAESQLALRAGRQLLPRLAPAAAGAGVGRPLDGGGTVLVTGGTGMLGALVARHLVAVHGVRHLV
ncbi:MAG: polyketide synthase dehydratase domain-containing protein, partial [Streptosporangiaceae bacterium]